jgi:hypothetical protein
MTVWGHDGAGRVYPISVLEWKCLNRQDRGTSVQRKRDEYRADKKWLSEVARLASPFVGYAVLVDQQVSPVSMSVARAFEGAVAEGWFVA